MDFASPKLEVDIVQRGNTWKTLDDPRQLENGWTQSTSAPANGQTPRLAEMGWGRSDSPNLEVTVKAISILSVRQFFFCLRLVKRQVRNHRALRQGLARTMLLDRIE